MYYYEGLDLGFQEKMKFFTQTRHSYGRTALMLSGGAGFGRYHNGVIMTLFEQDLLPNIIVGSSAGSLVAAGLCTFKRHELNNFKFFN